MTLTGIYIAYVPAAVAITTNDNPILTDR